MTISQKSRINNRLNCSKKMWKTMEKAVWKMTCKWSLGVPHLWNNAFRVEGPSLPHLRPEDLLGYPMCFNGLKMIDSHVTWL